MSIHPGSQIYVINRATVVTSDKVKTWCAAVTKQIREDVAPAWGLKPKNVVFRKSTAFVPSGAWIVVVMDDADQAGALGYHSTDWRGRVYARVFAKTALDYNESPSVTFSHEVLETFGDPGVDQWADTGYGYKVPVELCDAVEGAWYSIDGVRVSDFVYPAWFARPNHVATAAPYDSLGAAHAPFMLAPGGYTVREFPDGHADQVFAEHAHAKYVAAKTSRLSRAYRRLWIVS